MIGRLFGLGLPCLIASLNAWSGVVADSTRFIYRAGQRELPVMVANANDYPVLLQTWVDDGAGTPDDDPAFIVLPPVARIAPHAKLGLRIVATGKALPQDSESAFWLNLYEVPPATAVGVGTPQLALTLDTQLKLFYRPSSLARLGAPAASTIRAKTIAAADGDHLVLYNAGAYHVTLRSVVLSNEQGATTLEQQPDMMLAPHGSLRFEGPLPGDYRPAQVLLHSIDDAGFTVSTELPVD